MDTNFLWMGGGGGIFLDHSLGSTLFSCPAELPAGPLPIINIINECSPIY